MGAFEIRKGFDAMHFDAVVALLHSTYWANNRPEAQIRDSMLHSICYGVFVKDTGEQTGFARVITDYATTYYLCDVIVAEAYRRQGMGYALIEAVEDDPALCGLRGMLITRDANKLYERFGYASLGNRAMAKNLNC